MNCKGLGRKKSWFHLKHFSGSYLQGFRHVRDYVNHDTTLLSSDLNLGLPELGPGALSTGPWHLLMKLWPALTQLLASCWLLSRQVVLACVHSLKHCDRLCTESAIFHARFVLFSVFFRLIACSILKSGDVGSISLLNVGELLPDYTASRPRTCSS
jgi:hypothetical protein